MTRARSEISLLEPLGWLLSASLVGVIGLPLLALLLSASVADVREGMGDPLFGPALRLSMLTTSLSLALTVALGTPLSWWLATSTSRVARMVGAAVTLPIVLPPAVIGVALLQTFGRRGLLGPALAGVGITVPFTLTAVVLAQVVVSAPFFVQAAANAFRKVEPDLVIVARTLGASPAVAFVRVAVPVAMPGLVIGASLAWARSLGEFGATLLFAGNLSGTTQTMPLAIYAALQSDVRVALAFSLVLVGLGAGLLLGLRLVPILWARRTTEDAPATSPGPPAGAQ